MRCEPNLLPIWAQKTYSVFALHFFDKRKEGKGSMCCHSLLYMINIKVLLVFLYPEKIILSTFIFAEI